MRLCVQMIVVKDKVWAKVVDVTIWLCYVSLFIGVFILLFDTFTFQIHYELLYRSTATLSMWLKVKCRFQVIHGNWSTNYTAIIDSQLPIHLFWSFDFKMGICSSDYLPLCISSSRSTLIGFLCQRTVVILVSEVGDNDHLSSLSDSILLTTGALEVEAFGFSFFPCCIIFGFCPPAVVSLLLSCLLGFLLLYAVPSSVFLLSSGLFFVRFLILAVIVVDKVDGAISPLYILSYCSSSFAWNEIYMCALFPRSQHHSIC